MQDRTLTLIQDDGKEILCDILFTYHSEEFNKDYVVFQVRNEGNASAAIYHPEDNAEKVYVQVSKRKYNYTSDNAPYKSSDSDTTWYRSHYYSSSYSADSSTYHSPSAYTSYSGDTVHNIGNGYFDSYSSSVRQSSINSRNSSSGGVSSGK